MSEVDSESIPRPIELSKRASTTEIPQVYPRMQAFPPQLALPQVPQPALISPRGGTDVTAEMKAKKMKSPPEEMMKPSKIEKLTGVKFAPIPPPAAARLEGKLEMKVPTSKLEAKISNTMTKKDKSMAAVYYEAEPEVSNYLDTGKKTPSFDQKMNILNFGAVNKDVSTLDPNEISYTLVALVYYSLHDYVEYKNGEPRVDYKKWARSESYAIFEEHATYLQRVDPRRLGTYEDQLSFWINVHNALAYHACANHGCPTNEKDRKIFFTESIYKVGEYLLSLNDIGLGILRENAKKQFPEDDPRRQLIIPMHPCIHFALVHATKSSPFLVMYNANEVSNLMSWTTHVFLEREVEVSFSRNIVVMPKLFQENAKDFGKDTLEVLAFVCEFLGDTKSKVLQFIMSNNPEVQYKEYEWAPVAPNLLLW